jgi:hypothetical protein
VPEPAIDDILLQEIYSLREKLKIAIAAIKADHSDFDEQEFTHRLNSVDFDQLMEELAETAPAPEPEGEERIPIVLQQDIADAMLGPRPPIYSPPSLNEVPTAMLENAYAAGNEAAFSNGPSGYSHKVLAARYGYTVKE